MWGVFAIIGVLWTATNVAWLAGAEGVTVGNRYGPPATLDFMRAHDRPTLAVGDHAGLELNTGLATVQGSLARYKSGPPVLCLICGYSSRAGGIATGIEYRDSEWFYRAPTDHSQNSEARKGRQESRDYILTIAYNR
ncbi:MAG: hypothetical protein ACI9WU_003803, partial [Myxococcota bacterium]